MARAQASLLLLLATVLMSRCPCSSQQDSRRGVLLRQASRLSTQDRWGSESIALLADLRPWTSVGPHMRPLAWRQPPRQKSTWLSQQPVLHPSTDQVKLRRRQGSKQTLPQLRNDSHRRRRGGTKPLLLLVAQPLACHHSSSSRVLALPSLQRGAQQRRPAVHLGPLRRPLLALRLASLPQQRSRAGRPAVLLGARAAHTMRMLQRLLASPRRHPALGLPQRQQPSSLEQSLMPARRQALLPGGLRDSGMAGPAPAALGARSPLQALPPAQQVPELDQGRRRQLLCPWGGLVLMLLKSTGEEALSGAPASGTCQWAVQVESLPGAPARGGLAQHLPQVCCVRDADCF